MSNKEKNYKFQADWFSQNIPLWSENLSHLKDKPKIKLLEIGSFEGKSAVWTLENIATDPSSTLTCIDTFQGSMEDERLGTDASKIENTFRYNIEQAGATERVIVLKGLSRDRLKELSDNTYDFIYIDGSHIAGDVLTDAVMALYLLKPGGTMIFDDYYWDEEPNPIHRPKKAIDAFLDIFKEKITLIHKGEQVVVRRNDEMGSLGRVNLV